MDEIEIALYSTEVHEVELNEKELEFIQKITEGWLLGINQYLFLCKKNSLVNIDLTKFNLLNLEKIFLEELLEISPPSIIKTLRISSLFDRFSESLLQEVINGSEDELGFPIPCQYIQKLKENNFFLIQLDSEQTWFRFHHLFQAALVKYTNTLEFELERESFLKRGSNWFLKHGFFEDAILNALKTQNEEFAISQLSKIKYQLLNTDQYFRLKQIVSNFPLESQERQPELLITKAIILENEAKHEALFQQLRYIEEQVDFKVVDKQIKAEFLIFKGMGSYFIGNFDLALKLLNEGIELNKPKAESICTFANAYKVFSLNALGRYTEAIRFLDRHLDSLFPNQTQSIVRTHVAKALLLSIRGDFNNLEPLTNRILKISREFNYYESQGFALYFLADIYYRQYRFEYLSQIFEDAYEKRYLIRSVWFLKLWAIKAFYFLRIGNQKELDRTIQEINQFSDASNSSNLKHLAEALILEINLQNGKSFFANSSFANVDFELYPPMFYHYFTQNTLLRLLLERDDEQSQNSFEDKILSLEGYATQISHAGALARINILHALKSYRKGEMTKSEEYILKAISISEKANDYMVFSEYGIELYHLLNEITPTKKSRIFIDRLRQILKTLFQREIKLNSKFQTDPILNQRDIKILSLVAEGYSNSEIADQMNLSLNSIKKYLSNIFLILEVKNRTSAILKARDLGIFKS
ncbi:hypothetical protein E4S40_06235 [Algoriphagus kandeliae]|uniref:HTH luxR-type domain-containing protein n=1 Tax=Algoriphagus kandeliae TaxID=2562278 RepID=A0A4Y9QVJ3_9BACT|nr:LuxR C-terminal-related transcriptional regulator [Algoriphagus kandeliae]TFV95818.1 hypothetical protein E4S40_06235 [Algoriphagus kandeliae]